ncbi:hypothetical protein [Maricaulis sp.]|jgi:hypothetical protein|uniref:hypothetical protein n=1 Tax=Maricaulis sp. TaxID=1486257 RepID=UPI0026224D7D|nr:hypothetical protein [Maricaulis sp.]
MTDTNAKPRALQWARPVFLVGALLLLAGALVYRGIVPLEPTVIWTIVLMVPGGGFIMFGLTITAAGRVLAAAQAVPEEDRPTWDDEDEETK